MNTPRILRSLTLYGVIGCAVLSGACGSEPAPPPTPPVTAAPPPPPVAAAAETEQQPLQARTQEYEEGLRQRARAVSDQRSDLRRARVGFENEAGEELTPEQRKLLEERVARERGSRKNLLQEILDQDTKIRDLTARMQELAKSLPASHVAQNGDRHDRIAMNFLLAQGVPADRAYDLISKLNLEDALLPGFRVWTYYGNGQFGTWVTQGTAAISPAERQRRLREETEILRAQSTELAGQNAALKASNDELKQRAETSAAEVKAALDAAEEANRARAESAAIASTVQYAIGTKRALENARLIDGRLRLLAVDLPDAQPLNLAARQSLTFEPQSYDPKMKRVKRVRVAPSSLVEGQDYTVVSLGDVGVELRILNRAKFISAGRFLVVIE